MRLDDQGRSAIAGLGEARFQPRQIARQHGTDIGVDDRRRDPLELLDLRQHLGGQRHVRIRQGAGERLGGQALVARVTPSVQIADRDGLDLLALQDHDRRVERDRKSTRLNSSHPSISYAVFCLKKKTNLSLSSFCENETEKNAEKYH